jgi:hypothetical protein
MRDELVRRGNNTQRIAAFFKERPYQWIDARALESFGRQAWRTRLSNARIEHHMNIVNRLRRGDGVVLSEYCYQPAPVLVQDAYEVPMDGRLF